MAVAAPGFAAYHRERGACGGISWEFHARAESFLAADVPALIAYIDKVEQERDVARAEVAAFVRNEGDWDGALSDLGTELEEARTKLRIAGSDFAAVWQEVLLLRAQLATVTATRDQMIADIKKLARDIDEHRAHNRASK